MAQSRYAMEFLRQRNVHERHWLTDYIPSSAFKTGTPGLRLPIVAYNPKKGMEITQSLIARCGELPIWLKLEGLSQNEMRDLLQAASIYIDFGGHPGRDRIPREAALSGAIVITGRRGAAAFSDDVPLPDRFRLDEQAPNFEIGAASLVNGLLTSERNFLDASTEQEGYRRWVSLNRENFMREIDDFVKVVSPARAA